MADARPAGNRIVVGACVLEGIGAGMSASSLAITAAFACVNSSSVTHALGLEVGQFALRASEATWMPACSKLEAAHSDLMNGAGLTMNHELRCARLPSRPRPPRVMRAMGQRFVAVW